jgi:ABC-type multidrug transport system fused ATPase/permease subunit
LVGWLVFSLVDWLVGWFVCLFVGWFVRWLVAWIAEWLVGRSVGLSAGWLADWLVGWLDGCVIDWIGWMFRWLSYLYVGTGVNATARTAIMGTCTCSESQRLTADMREDMHHHYTRSQFRYIIISRWIQTQNYTETT